MNNNLQEYKKNFKFDLLNKLINRLSSYNSIRGYDNQKRFTFNIEERYAKDKDKKVYEVKLLRGINNQKEIFVVRILADKLDNSSIINFLENVIYNNSLYYTSFTNMNNKPFKYNINLENDILVEFVLKNDIDIENCKKIEERFNDKVIVVKKEENSSINKDELQKEKAIRIIDIFSNILFLINEYNSKEDYDNVKPFLFAVSNYYDKEKECFIYSFNIKRGSVIEENVLTLRASIIDNSVIYEKLYDLLNKVRYANNYVIQSFNYSTNPYYAIKLNSNINLKFSLNNNIDRIFYKKFSELNNDKLDSDKDILKLLKK